MSSSKQFSVKSTVQSIAVDSIELTNPHIFWGIEDDEKEEDEDEDEEKELKCCPVLWLQLGQGFPKPETLSVVW